MRYKLIPKATNEVKFWFLFFHYLSMVTHTNNLLILHSLNKKKKVKIYVYS